MREQQQRAIPQGNELQAQPIQSEKLKSDGKAHGCHSCHSCHTHEDTEEHNNHEHKHEHHRHAHSSTKRQIILIAVTAVLLAAAVLIERYCALQTWQLLLVYLVPYLLIGPHREILRPADLAAAPGLPRPLPAHRHRHPERSSRRHCPRKHLQRALPHVPGHHRCPLHRLPARSGD